MNIYVTSQFVDYKTWYREKPRFTFSVYKLSVYLTSFGTVFANRKMARRKRELT